MDVALCRQNQVVQRLFGPTASTTGSIGDRLGAGGYGPRRRQGRKLPSAPPCGKFITKGPDNPVVMAIIGGNCRVNLIRRGHGSGNSHSCPNDDEQFG